MKKSTTLRSLLLCGLSMLLCLSMLAGTTFAWFTDSVESGRNQIVAGNLDVELYNGLDNTANKIDENTKLFNMTLWEPGAMVYENFTVANEGTLALKYQLGVNVANATANANGDTLAKVLKVAVVEDGIADGTTREALQQLDNYTSLASFVESGKLEEAETKTYGIVIWWEPSDIDNEFNMNNENKGKIMSIDIGVKLYATQVESADEKDSFDEFYDEDAWMDAMQVLTADDLQAAVENAKSGDKIIVMDDITFDGDFVIPATATTYSLRAAAAAGVAINLNGYTLSAANVTTDGIATIVNGTLALPADGFVYASDDTSIVLENVKIESDGVSAYAVRNGSVSLKNVTFINTATSNPVQNYGGYMTLENVTVAQAGDANTAWYSSAVQVINLLVQDENGKYGITAQADTVINSGTYTGKKAIMISAPGGNVTINGGTFNGSEYAIQADFAPQYYTDGANYTSVITINGGTFNGAIKATAAAKVVIYGGTFSHDPSAFVADGYSAVLENDGTYTVLPGDNTELVENGLYKDGNTYYVTDADGMLALSTKSATYFGGKTIKLVNDIDCTDVAMKKIYIFDPEYPTTFDGCGYTIYNLDISTAANADNQGLFHGTVNVKNLTVDGAWVQGSGYVGVIASTLYGNIENCHVKNAQVFAGYWQAGIIVGQFNGTSIKDCSVVDSEIYGPSAVAAIAGIFTDNSNTDIKFENCVVKNCDINQTYSFGADYDILFGAILGCGNVGGKNYIFNDCVVENTTIKGVASDAICGEADKVLINGLPMVYTADQLAAVVKAGATNILLADGEYDIYGCGGKTLTITGSKNAVIKVANEGEAGSDYAFDGSTVTFNGVTFDTSANNGSYKGYARMIGIYNDCTFNGSYALNKDSEFTNCTFNVSGDAYNLWTWGAPNATFTGCTFNSDGKAVLLYGGVDTNLTLNGCTFNDNGGLSDKKAAIEIGNDYGRSYTLTVNNTVVNGYEINDKGISTGTTLWGNKNSMGTDKLNVIVDGVDVY